MEIQEVQKKTQEYLKKRGVLRIACPDSEFLFNVSLFKNEYWKWRHPTFMNKNRFETNWDELCQYDFLMKETAAPRMRFYKNKITSKVMNIDYVSKFEYKDFIFDADDICEPEFILWKNLGFS